MINIPIPSLSIVCAGLSRSVVSDSLLPHGLAYQAPLSMGFGRQEYWSGLLLPSLRILAVVAKVGIKMSFYCISRSVRRPCEDGYGDWTDATTCQELTGATRR